MSIQSEITRISGNVSDAFDAVTAKGGTVPTGATSDDLATAIASISGGGGLPEGIVEVTSSLVEVNQYTLVYDSFNNDVEYENKSSDDYKVYIYTLPYQDVGSTDMGYGYVIATFNRRYYPVNYAIFATNSTTGKAINAQFNSDDLWRYNYVVLPLNTGSVGEIGTYNHWFAISDASGSNPTINGLRVFYIRFAKEPVYQDITRTITTNGTTTITKSDNYPAINSVTITTNVPSSLPTYTSIAYTLGTLTGGGTYYEIDLSSIISNKTTPFTIVFIGGKTTGTAAARLLTFITYDGSGSSGSTHFTIYQPETSSNHTTFKPYSVTNAGVFRFQIGSGSYYYPGGSSSLASLQLPVMYNA